MVCEYCGQPATKYDEDCQAWMCHECLDEVDEYLKIMGLKEKK